jgi:hypothetical protein
MARLSIEGATLSRRPSASQPMADEGRIHSFQELAVRQGEAAQAVVAQEGETWSRDARTQMPYEVPRRPSPN